MNRPIAGPPPWRIALGPRLSAALFSADDRVVEDRAGAWGSLTESFTTPPFCQKVDMNMILKYGHLRQGRCRSLDVAHTFDTVPLYIDNEAAMKLTKNPEFHSLTKHMELRHQLPQERFLARGIPVMRISSEGNAADILTKAISRDQFEYL